MDRTSWKPKVFKAEEIVDYKAEEGYGIGTPAGDIIWKYFDEVHRMDQDDVHCKICGKMMTEPVRKAGVAGDGMGGLAQQQVYFDHLKQEHGITESKANEYDDVLDDYYHIYLEQKDSNASVDEVWELFQNEWGVGMKFEDWEDFAGIENPSLNDDEIKAKWNEEEGNESKANEDDLDWTKDKPEGGIPFYCPLCHMTIEENATWDGVFDHNKQIHNMTDENAEILAKGFTYSNSPPTSFESKSTEAYGTCNICHKKMNGTGCVGHFEIDGERYSRIGYGEDGNYDEDGCRDCGVKQFGDKHHWNCDNEKCPACRGQALGCDCDDFELIVDGSESMTQMDDSSDSPSTINAARKMMKGQLDSYNDNPTPEERYEDPLITMGYPWQRGGENDFSKKYSYLDKPQVKDEIMPMVDLYHGGQRIGQIRNYNPMGHLGLVTMDAIGIEEYGALPSDYEAYINGKRIPNKWDNQVDHNASFFGENDMKDYEKYDDWDDESEVRSTESWGHWTDNEPMKSHDQVKLMKDLGIADKTLRQMGYLHKDGVEGFIERIEKELSKFGINLDKDKDQVKESKTSEGFDQGLYGHVDAKCKTCGIEFDSIPDMDDHYAMHSDHISNLDDLDSNIPNSD